MLKKIALSGVGLVLLASPLATSADLLSDLQAQIQALLAQVAALQQQDQGDTDDYGTGVTPTGIFCPDLSKTMQKGARDATTGGQVSELQAFLTSYYDLDENIVVGGYFGNLTHKYVVQFQTEHGLPAFGIVGSLTRAKIASVCGGIQTSITSFIATPQSGQAPLEVSFRSNIGGVIHFGDGTSGTMDEAATGNSGPAPFTAYHTYTASGTYTATLQTGSNSLTQPIVVSAQIGNISCTLDGITKSHNESHTFYSSRTAISCSSIAQARTCQNGSFGGSSSYKYATCTPAAAVSCTLDNATLRSGESRTFYLDRTGVPSCDPISQTRTCENGVLAGNTEHRYAACTSLGVRLVFIGDSYSDPNGAGAERTGYSYGTWPNILATVHPYFQNRATWNFAHSGYATDETLRQFGEGNLDGIQSTPGSTYFFSWVGASDTLAFGRTAEATYERIKEIWQKAHALGFKVIAFTQGDTCPGLYSQAVIDQNNALSTLIRNDPTKYEFLVDYSRVLPHPCTDFGRLFFADNIHPNVYGNTLIAAEVAQALGVRDYLDTSMRLFIQAVPSTLKYGESSTIVWFSAHASWCEMKGPRASGSALGGAIPVSGFSTPDGQVATYTLTCGQSNGTTQTANATILLHD